MQQPFRKPSEAEPGRMGRLSKLPVFFDLRGRRAVIVGGSPGAAWKAELLAAAGAHVDVYALEVCAEMETLLARGAAGGHLALHRRAWTSGILDRAALAVADLEGEGEAEDFAAAAHEAGVPVNVVDKPDYCDFQFGSVVNRSPVVIGISTDGAAPILGQAIRRRIETLLHPSLAAWASLAKAMRERIMEQLPPGLSRRAFWERFADLAFQGRPPETLGSSVEQVLRYIALRPVDSKGRVTLVGAGPGDAELLTLRAVRALQAADVILFDDLVSEDVLELARREAKRLIVGKRGGRASCAQEDINDLMAGLALQGKHVVRLKSGDPMIFGRAGEEIEHLERAGVPVDVVPGITAGIALASALGVSLTHRDMAQSVRFVTGCARTGRLPDDLDWPGLADIHTTAIFYMAGGTAGAIATRLMEQGVSPSTPSVMVSNVSRSNDRWAGPLSELGEASDRRDSAKPVIIGIGRVFGKAVHVSARHSLEPVQRLQAEA
ncbi:siroheme synthase CysG [Microvirga arsenatis]|uniref:Uroporphyrinogen-III C-methyltransferase n=1 Tax=Microvirga arsenatis TaxID=2692265 RepID=A0ABW9Z2Q4_9HYPH|nr:siroheme synthase CysG [Microvirga arsenatis]NBJ12846.1 uroporphyrinogen-III C-methyltransferase [Microvirga arsenatis]NBJ26705.1 uroporphyrinogen-III C-methyltransferase [Microvirga arsenatis]